ncbi:MAG TPA: biotin synthetase [Pseudobdellovibrionaceae bacterium]|jgi:BirA family biotin operon repressor/biotin-[acetyl-CoA-carboxylase] ligase
MQDSPLNDVRLGTITKKWAESNRLFVHYEASMGSTNDRAKGLAFEERLLQEGLCLFLTDDQTAGRGRGKNIWLNSKPGSALLSSWSYLLNMKPQPTTSCLVGLAVYRALSTTWPFLNWNIKAPNDIYIDDKKIAGILLESVIQGDETRLILGLGINVLASPAEVGTAKSILESLPPGVPLLGQDWTACLDRLMFEMSEAISHCEEPLSPSEQYSLLMALNAHPLLKEKYKGLEPNGTLLMGSGKKINWWEL